MVKRVLGIALAITTAMLFPGAYGDEWLIVPGKVYNLHYPVTPSQTVTLNIPLTTVKQPAVVTVTRTRSIIHAPGATLGPAVAIGPAMGFEDVVTLTLPFGTGHLPVAGQKVCVWYQEAQEGEPVVIAEETLLGVDKAQGTATLEIKKTGIYQVGTWEALGGNWPPASFSLYHPQDGKTLSLSQENGVVRFSWQSAVDPNNDPVSYAVIFAHDAALTHRIATLPGDHKNSLAVSVTNLKASLGAALSRQIYWGGRGL